MAVNLVDREAECTRLSAMLTAALDGRAGICLIAGEAGIGKTAMLAWLAETARTQGAMVVSLAGEELEQDLPFSIFATHPLDGRGGASPGVLGDQALRERVAQSFLTMVDDAHDDAPVVMTIDDLQWADRGSLAALTRLVSRRRVMLAVAYRPAPQRAELARFLHHMRTADASWLTLDALPETSVAALTGQVLGANVGDGLAVVAQTAGGNPLYVIELVGGLLRSGAIVVDAGRAELADDTAEMDVPASLRAKVLDRLGYLSPASRELLAVAAVLGTGFDLGALQSVTESPPTTLMCMAREAVTDGILDDRDSWLTFRHEVIRRVFAEGVPPAIRASIHGRLGSTLAQWSGPVEHVAQQFLRAPSVNGEEISWVLASTDELTARSPADAVSLIGRVLRAIGANDARAPILRCRLAQAMLRCGDHTAAVQAAELALAAETAADGTLSAELRWVLAQALMYQGDLVRALAVAEKALAAPRLPWRLFLRLRAFVLQCSFMLGEGDRLETAEDDMAAAQATGDLPLVAYVSAASALVHLYRGMPRDALGLAERALEILGSGRVPADLSMVPQLAQGGALLELDRPAEADAALAAGISVAADTGQLYLGRMHAARAMLCYLTGRWNDASDEIDAGLRVVDRLGVHPGLRNAAALIAVHRGHFAEARHWLDESPSRTHRYLGDWATALILEAEHRPGDGLHILFAAWDHRAASATDQPALHQLSPELMRLAMAVGDTGPARRVADVMDQLAAVDQPRISVRSTAYLCRGILEPDEAILRKAAQGFRATGRVRYEGLAWEELAVHLAKVGDMAGARGALHDAVRLYTSLGAVLDSARVESRLRAHGIRHGVRGPRRRPKSGWDSLTVAERRVAVLVTEGLTNPAIAERIYLSRRTVQTHVSSILHKLDLSTRVELALAVARHG
jgi:DNA-binding CsgD family transcriptional regulator/tetratricopeptide (TPR) repeat protein